VNYCHSSVKTLATVHRTLLQITDISKVISTHTLTHFLYLIPATAREVLHFVVITLPTCMWYFF